MSDAVTGDPWVPVGVAGDVVDVAGPAAVGRPSTVDCTTPMSCAGGISGSRTASTTDTVLATVAAVLAACLIVIRFSFFLHLHLVRRDLSPVRNTVSDLGTGRSRREFTVMGALTAVAYVLVLLACQGQGTGPGVQLVILAAAIADMVVMLGFPTDLTGTGRTRSGRIHLILAVVQFTGIFVATVNLDTLLDHAHRRESEGESQAGGREPGPVLHHDRGLAQRGDPLRGQLTQFPGGGVRDDDLDEFRCGHRVEEVQTADPLRVSGDLTDSLSEVVDGGAMTGMASVAMRSKIRELMPASAFARRRSRSWVMSAPEAEIPLGLLRPSTSQPVMTRTRGSSSSSSQTACRSSTMAWSTALRISGRLRRTSVWVSVVSTVRVEKVIPEVWFSSIPFHILSRGIARARSPRGGLPLTVSCQLCSQDPHVWWLTCPGG